MDDVFGLDFVNRGSGTTGGGVSGITQEQADARYLRLNYGNGPTNGNGGHIGPFDIVGAFSATVSDNSNPGLNHIFTRFNTGGNQQAPVGTARFARGETIPGQAGDNTKWDFWVNTDQGNGSGAGVFAGSIGCFIDTAGLVNSALTTSMVLQNHYNGVNSYSFWTNLLRTIIGGGAAGIDYKLIFDGQSTDGTLTYLQTSPGGFSFDRFIEYNNAVLTNPQTTLQKFWVVGTTDVAYAIGKRITGNTEFGAWAQFGCGTIASVIQFGGKVGTSDGFPKPRHEVMLGGISPDSDLGGTIIAHFDSLGFAMRDHRFRQTKGTNVIAANNLTLGNDGNMFIITGNTTINAITTAGWTDASTTGSSEIILLFTGTPTVKHNTAGGAGTAKLKLLSSIDITTVAADFILGLVLMYDGSTYYWQETFRKTP